MMANVLLKILELSEHSTIRRKRFAKLVNWSTRMADVHQSRASLFRFSSVPVISFEGMPCFFTAFAYLEVEELTKVGAIFEAKLTWFNTDGDIFLKDIETHSKLERKRFYLKENYNILLY